MKRTAQELADHLQATVEGDARVVISGLARPEDASAEDLIYVDAAKHLPRCESSAARCALVREGMKLPGKTLIVVREPKLAFAKAAAWMLEQQPIASRVHPTALIDGSATVSASAHIGPYVVIEEGVVVGAGTEIGAFCFVGRGAKIGESCRLYPRVTLYAGAKLANRVIVHAGAVIGGDGFGYVYGEGKNWKFPQLGGVEIDNDVEIGSNSTIARGSLGTTRIERGVKVDNLVHIAHNVRVGEHTVIAAQTGISGSCDIGRHVLIGGQAGLGEHCKVEDGAILGGQSGILNGKTVREGQMVWGTPARPLGEFKKQYAQFARLPELAERVRRLEEKRDAK
ncbi:MAG TPA: UDP-3-O-(3-hydroxymyristoyl)glucosamine N-acyltransferase [Candidatus Acidoferrales bacterium]|nr:UDP-3-O-(3-hydroxymyristoyl)glucosamine N-acyltransferase [Candidatus Acidoferrales bacterium]